MGQMISASGRKTDTRELLSNQIRRICYGAACTTRALGRRITVNKENQMMQRKGEPWVWIRTMQTW